MAKQTPTIDEAPPTTMGSESLRDGWNGQYRDDLGCNLVHSRIRISQVDPAYFPLLDSF